MSHRIIRTLPLFLLVLTLTGCHNLVAGFFALGQAVTLTNTTPPPEPVTPVALIPDVLADYPHDSGAFTQGLLLAENGLLYESTGLYGESSLREVDPATGAVLRQVDLDETYFGEGLALVEDRLIQITWKNEVALVYDIATFALIDTYAYSGEGWGLCYDAGGDTLYMTDGSHTVFTRDPYTFELTGQFEVYFNNQPVTQLNELECVGDLIYANIWMTDLIIAIDKHSGQIVEIIQANQLLTQEEALNLGNGGTLNGIAYNPETETFLITGKLFPRLFEVRFVPLN